MIFDAISISSVAPLISPFCSINMRLPRVSIRYMGLANRSVTYRLFVRLSHYMPSVARILSLNKVVSIVVAVLHVSLRDGD